ncbi:MAG: beta strand repeat-containing protein [Acidimicrobiales bacterium]
MLLRHVLRFGAVPYKYVFLAVVLVAGGLWLVVPASSAAADGNSYYAFAQGTGTPTGCPTESKPKTGCSLGEALSQAGAGDTILLATPGSSESYVGTWTVSTSGTSPSEPLTIEPAAGVVDPTLSGNGGSTTGCTTGTCNGPVLSLSFGVSLTVEGLTIEDGSNHALTAGGGAIDTGDGYEGAGGTLTVSDSTFIGNYGGDAGGAISNANDAGSGTALISGSTFIDNSAESGGAISNGEDNSSGSLSVTDSTFSGNSASPGGLGSDGGAIDNGDDGSGTLSVSDSTFSGDSATDGPEIDNADTFGHGTVYVAGNIFDGSCDQAGGTWYDEGYNVGTDGTCENGGPDDSMALTSSELGPLASNGGPTETVLPLAGNPGLARVPNPTSVTLNGSSVALCPVTDQRGVASGTGLACNAGAVQGAAGLYAAPSAVGTGNCSSAVNACTLQTALSEAAAGSTVYLVQPGTEGTASSYYIGNWDVDTSETSTSSQVTIEPGPGVTSAPILDGDGTSAGTCETTSCDGPVLTISGGVYATIEGITIQNADNTTTYFGGAIDSGGDRTLTVSDDTFTGNSANAGDGGAIDNGDTAGGGGTLSVTDSTFADNSSIYDGGAIDNGDGNGNGTLSVADSTFTGNSANYDGGAIDNGDSIGRGTLSVADSTFTGNSARLDGGAIDNGDDGSGTLSVADSTFTGNPARDGGTIDSGDTGGSGTGYVGADIFDGSCDQAGGSWTDEGYNLGTNGSCQNGGTGDITDAGLTLPGLADNGGPTKTILPALGSPAIGKIPTGTSLNGVQVCSRHDQRGVASFHKCTIGAVEGGFLITTTSLPSASPGKHYHPVHLTTQEAGSHATLSWTEVKLPSGMTLSKAGVLSGKPSKSLEAGQTSIKVKVTETVGGTKTTVEATIALTIT